MNGYIMLRLDNTSKVDIEEKLLDSLFLYVWVMCKTQCSMHDRCGQLVVLILEFFCKLWCFLTPKLMFRQTMDLQNVKYTEQ